jgi:hypothetical protein
MGGAHAALAWAALVSVAVLLVVAALSLATGRRSHRAIDLAIVGQAVVTGAAALLGAATAVAQAPPRDALHVLYGALAAVAPAICRAIGHRGGSRSIARWVAAGALVALGATVRSVMTGS